MKADRARDHLAGREAQSIHRVQEGAEGRPRGQHQPSLSVDFAHDHRQLAGHFDVVEVVDAAAGKFLDVHRAVYALRQLVKGQLAARGDELEARAVGVLLFVQEAFADALELRLFIRPDRIDAGLRRGKHVERTPHLTRGVLRGQIGLPCDLAKGDRALASIRQASGERKRLRVTGQNEARQAGIVQH